MGFVEGTGIRVCLTARASAALRVSKTPSQTRTYASKPAPHHQGEALSATASVGQTGRERKKNTSRLPCPGADALTTAGKAPLTITPISIMAQFLARRHCQITQRNAAGLCQKVRQLTILPGWQGDQNSRQREEKMAEITNLFLRCRTYRMIVVALPTVFRAALAHGGAWRSTVRRRCSQAPPVGRLQPSWVGFLLRRRSRTCPPPQKT